MTTNRFKRLATVVAGLFALLAGCTINIYHDGKHHSGGGKASATNPMVVVEEGKVLRVDPDPITFAKDQVDVTVTWHLPKGKGLRFPPNAITFDAAGSEEFVKCRPSEDASSYSCLNRHSKPGRYKYDVLVQQDGKLLDKLDPEAWNF